ncbi:ATP-binding protein, partial [Mesorhizobium silamurunense]|uniref:ATP-binding protein n=1 Tax=Mesorhizobium silamurunense TaxID=499528 RepID=UPI001AEE6278
MESENIKKLKAVAIEPEGNVIEITGDNDQGKTSLLDSIYWALGGVGAIQDDPIRQGEVKARIFLDIGSLQITRRINRTEDGSFSSTLVIENEEGMRAPS